MPGQGVCAAGRVRTGQLRLGVQRSICDGRRAKKPGQATLGHGVCPDVHGYSQQKRRRHGQGGSPQPRRSGLGLQFVRHGRKYLRTQFRPHAAGRQLAEQLFNVIVHKVCLPNHAGISPGGPP